jgi:Fe-S-cluster containining protein
MLLLKEDIEHLKRLGFNYNYFVVDRDGWLHLKNYNGRCVFNGGKKCSIYEYRPEGCKLYPIIYDEDKNSATLDEDCPHRDEFKISKIKGEIVISLVAKLIDERRQRRNEITLH